MKWIEEQNKPKEIVIEYTNCLFKTVVVNTTAMTYRGDELLISMSQKDINQIQEAFTKLNH